MRESGDSLRKIARTLDEKKVPSRGKKWWKTSISRILDRDKPGEDKTKPDRGL